VPPHSHPLPSLAIALGANLKDPLATLIAVRPLLAAVLLPPGSGDLVTTPRLRWSPLFRTEAVGGPAGQPDYLNAALLLEPLPPGAREPLTLLRQLQALEARFARQRRERWGPRSLDLDLLWCGTHAADTAELQLPHPRLLERSFVLAPLAAIDPELVPPGQAENQPPEGPSAAPLGCGELLAQLQPRLAEAPPERLTPRPGWPE
jgi:2-amino-4-hydroxy-6-hydroxymethyldihydropteridine diphosphokinase